MSIPFTCPHCRAPLKIRDESFVGTALACPECQAALMITRNAAGEIIGQEAQLPKELPTNTKAGHSPPTPQTKPAAGAVSKTVAGTSLLPSHPETRVPPYLTWIVAGVCLLVLTPFLIPRSGPNSPLPPAGKQAQNLPSKEADKPTEATPPAAHAAPAPAATAPVPAVAETPEGRLTELGKLVLSSVKTEGHFPSGAVPAEALALNQRWSWLAQLAAKQDNPNGLSVAWNQRWNDPSQDRFVRRPIARFQNPLVPTIVSEDRYPANHFVGVAGVGIDAPNLPSEHARAGIFGADRQTRLEQIGDGTSNTMLIAGVEDHLGSWAAGTASYRPFTQEPYIHGPDGFGTGQPDRMLVLMADGSVREVSTRTDPKIVRRMAAMNDGLALDSKVPGEPGAPRPSPAPAKQHVVKGAPPDKAQPPATVVQAMPPLVKPVQPPIDIPAALSRKVLKFEQIKPAAAYQLLLQIEELSGVRIEYDRQQLGVAAERLDKSITLRRDNVSLADLLDEILTKIKLDSKHEPTLIRIIDPDQG